MMWALHLSAVVRPGVAEARDVMADYICPDTKESCGDDPCRWCDGCQCPAAIALIGLGAWVSVAERVPKSRQSVALLNIDKWENVAGDWSRNVQACGYWNDLYGGGYWSVRGGPALCREAFTHWTAMPDMPLPPIAGPNVRAKRATTAWRAGQQAQNGPKAQRLMAGVPRCWCSA